MSLLFPCTDPKCWLPRESRTPSLGPSTRIWCWRRLQQPCRTPALTCPLHRNILHTAAGDAARAAASNLPQASGIRVSIRAAAPCPVLRPHSSSPPPRVPQQPCQPMGARVEKTPHHSHEWGTQHRHLPAACPSPSKDSVPHTHMGRGAPHRATAPATGAVSGFPLAVPMTCLPNVPVAPYPQGPGPGATTGTQGVGHQHPCCWVPAP